MYNLKSVYVAFSIESEQINLVISDNENGAFNLLWSDSVANDNFYNKEMILKPQKLKNKLYEMLLRASENVDLVIEKVLVSFDGLTHDFKVKELQTDAFVFKNINNLRDRIEEAVYSWNATKNLTEPRNTLWWQITQMLDIETKEPVDVVNLISGRKYCANIEFYSAKSKLIADFSDIISSLGLKIINVSLCQLDFYSIINKHENHMIVDMHDDCSHVLFFTKEKLVSKLTINYGENDIFEFISKNTDPRLFNFKKIKEMIRSYLKINTKNTVNIVCKTDDKFLNMGYMNTQQFFDLFNKALVKFAQEIDVEIKNLCHRYDIKIHKLSFFARTPNLAKHMANIKSFINLNVKTEAIENKFLLLEDQYLLSAFTIMRQVKHDNKYSQIQSCVQPYFSSNFDKQIQKNLTVLALTNDVTKLVQKIIK